MLTYVTQVCTCFLSSQGLKVTVEQAKSVQANAFIQASLFQQFVFRQEASLAFKINLAALIECLNIFGGSGGPECHTALKMCYAGYGSPLTLLLEESGVLTDCSIQTQDADEILEFDFCSANVVNKVIMSAECLREVFAELDMSSEALEILLSPSSPYCRLSTSGYAGTTQIDYPKDSDMMQVFECQESLRYKYKLALLKPCQKAVNQSVKISIRMDRRGFLSLQCMIATNDKQICFVEYLCVPDEDGDAGEG
jgi:cell cycle checkpoint protein